jgi:ribosomal protein L40E
MIMLSYIILPLLPVAAVVTLILLVVRSRREAIEKAKAEQLSEANRPLNVWICRYCGFMSSMRSEVCSGCGSPRPEEFIYRTIPPKELAALIRLGTGGGKAGKASVKRSPDADGGGRKSAEFRKVRPAHHPGR